VAMKAYFYDYHPAPADFFREVVDGLRRRPRYIPPKFFYDDTGSRLFDAICKLPEYYLTRTETRLLQDKRSEIAELAGPDCVLVEPGSGSSDKVRLLLDALRPRMYVPIDISKDYLRTVADNLAADYPWLEVRAACADFTQLVDIPFFPAGVRRVAFFPGSSIGNFDPDAAVVFLRDIAAMVGPGGGLLIGVDLKKDPALLHAAYNDAQQVTAAFNLNLLSRINRELEADFRLDDFRHQAFYDPAKGRIEMHLVSRRDQQVHIDGEVFEFHAGESIQTENSYKYWVDELQQLAARAGFTPQRVWTDAEDLFSLHFFVAQPSPSPTFSTRGEAT